MRDEKELGPNVGVKCGVSSTPISSKTTSSIEFMHKKNLNGLAKKKPIKDIMDIFQVMWLT